MSVQPAPEITLTHGNHVVRLVPTLRAATILEQSDGGFPAVLRRIEDLHTDTIRAVVMAGASSRTAADAFLTALGDLPLSKLRTVATGPCLALIAAVMAPDVGDATPTTRATSAPVAWADLYSELFGIGTGWLGWTAAETWNATLPEIIAAFEAHGKKLRAIHGGEDEDSQPATMSAEEHAAIVAQGSDPAFDRDGLHALRGKFQ